MNEKELNEMIDWCRKKLADEKKKPVGFRLTSKSMDGYEKAIKAVMSYLHSMKEGNENA